MPKRYAITVSAAELEVVSLALGRMPDAKPVREKAAPRARSIFGKPPTLSAEAKTFLSQRWTKTVQQSAEKPGVWLDALYWEKMRDVKGKHAIASHDGIDNVNKAWGIVPRTTTTTNEKGTTP